jgi:hypothetical protein
MEQARVLARLIGGRVPMMPNSKDIADAKRLLGVITEPDKETFNRFARSESAEIRTALYEKLCDRRPPFAHLDEVDVDDFRIEFLARSFEENSKSENEYSRFYAATDLAYWCNAFSEEGKQHLLLRLRDLFAELWRNGGHEERATLITSVFEHIFQNSCLRDFFDSWSTDPELAIGYSKGVEFAKQLAQAPEVEIPLALREKDPELWHKNVLDFARRVSERLE